jgi:uncharacterized membrane protein YeaQ/YmgE (transglycosylase-associated protein family)
VEAVGYVLVLALNGLLVGALARLLLPGPDPMSVFQTLLVGVAGSLIAGLITFYAFEEAAAWGFAIALVCSIAIVFAIRKFRERQLGPEAARRRHRSASAFGSTSPSGFGGTPGSGGATVRFMPGCLIGSLLASLILTILLNLLIRAF